jgi:hypothetical protein
MSFKIERRDGAEVYASDSGFVCIKQENSLEEESTVAFHPDEIDELVTHLEKIKKEAIEIRAENARHSCQ